MPNLSVGSNCFSISWEFQIGTKSNPHIKFIWRQTPINLTAIYTSSHRSRTVVAKLNYTGKENLFGIGQSSVGKGYIGKHPDIIIGNHALKFSFGFNYIHVFEKEISPDLNRTEYSRVYELLKPCFKFIYN